MDKKITKIEAEEIKDSRGTPTIKVTVWVGDNFASFSVPSGASTGVHEAHELRDEDGKGVKNAIGKINTIISEALIGKDVQNQNEIDRIMIKLDGTPNKDNLGSNSMIGVSIACAKAAAKVLDMEVFEYLRALPLGAGEAVKEIKPSRAVPYLYMNLINGGKHAKNDLAFQEYHIVPDTKDITESVEIGIKIQNTLKEIIGGELGLESLSLGDEGGLAPKVSDIRKPLEYLTEALKRNNLSNKVRFALDVAASSFYIDGMYKIGDKKVSKDELMEIYKKFILEFNLLSIEDPFDEEDFESFRKLKEENNNLLVVGDDLTVTNKVLLKEALEKGSVNTIIIKPNQIGTLSETLETMQLARENNINIIVSHRSGETGDDFIADLAYAYGCFGLKSGSPVNPERMVKYQRLIKITQKYFLMKGSKAQIVATIGPASGDKEMIRDMVKHQADVFRLNFSWGTYEEHAVYIKNIREVSEDLAKRIPIIQDLSGPRVQEKSGHEFNKESVTLLSQKDIADLIFGIGQGVDYVAMSYVGSAKDVLELREKIKELTPVRPGGVVKVTPIIAKIERKVALDNIDEIIEVADAIMIARGDMGNEVPLEKIPFIEKEIIEKAKKAGKPVIVATQMMLSMTENKLPTRAEVTDVAYAIISGADAVMLSEESASGKHPLEAVEMMEKGVFEAEKHIKNLVINAL
ncbi:MAG: pyruvate kinase [Minisyncoccia bacterium]